MLRVVKAKRNPRPNEAEVVTSIRLTRDQHARLKALAASEHRSLSQQLRHVIDGMVPPGADDPPRRRAADEAAA